MKDENRSIEASAPIHEPKHQFEHAPTVIHDPEEDLTLLAKWVKHNLEGGKLWLWIGGLVAVVVVAALGASAFSGGETAADNPWTELAVANTAGQKVELAEEHPTSDAAQAARLQAASEFFSEATRSLPDNKEAALPLLRKALDLFEKVAKDARPNSPEGLAAAVGIARTHETRNELPEAIQQYKQIVEKWPNSPEAKDAERLAKALQEPEVIAFYRDLYAYKPSSALLPPGGSSSINLPGLPANHPDLSGPTMPAPGLTLPALPPITSPPSGGVTPGATMPVVPALPPSGPGPLDIAPPPVSTPAPAPAEKAKTVDPKKDAPPVLPADPFAKPAAPK